MKTPADLAARLAKQWQLADNREVRLLHADSWPLLLPIGKPTPTELTRNTDRVRAHLQRWRSVTIGEIAYEKMTFRGGSDPVEVPVAWRLRSAQEWVAATADPIIQGEYARLRTLLHAVNPIFHRTLIRQRACFAEQSEQDVIKATQVALQLTPGCAYGRPLRLLSIPGTDTKFLERQRGLMIQLLDVRFGCQVSDVGLEAFLGALDADDHWLLIAPLAPGLLPFQQQRVRASELRHTSLPGSHLLIVENEKCLHQLPALENTLAILGAGLHLEWLSTPAFGEKRIAYWGDMDTWGLTILAKARAFQPHLTPLMMDRDLFDTHRALSVPEHSPAAEQPPDGLTPAERDFYRYLRSLDHGRIEQEFVPGGEVVVALERWRAAI